MNTNWRTYAYSAMVLAALIWGLNAQAVVVASKPLGVYAFLALRFWLAVITYRLVLMTIPGLRWAFVLGPDRGRFIKYGVAVGLLLVGFYALQTRALQQEVVKGVFLTATSVVWVPVLVAVYRWADGRPSGLSRDAVAGVAFIVAGLAVMEGWWNQFAFTLAAQLALAGAICYALEMIAISAYAESKPPAGEMLVWTAFYSTGAAIVFTVLSLATEQPALAIAAAGDGVVWGWVVFSGVVATALAQFLANWAVTVQGTDGQQLIPPVHRAIIENLDAPFAAGFIALFVVAAGQAIELGAEKICGSSLIFTGVLVAELGGLSAVSRWATGPPRPPAAHRATVDDQDV